MPWKQLPNHAEILGVHAAYVGFGKILYFGGDEFDPQHSEHHRFDAARLFDCNSHTVETVASPAFDAFCSGHAFLGKAQDQVQLVVAGGTERWIFDPHSGAYHHGHFPGLKDTAVFETPHFANPSGPGWDWTKAADMNRGLLKPSTPDDPDPDSSQTGGRWYPTLTTLPNGDVIAFSGHPGSADADHNNLIPEVFSPNPAPRGRWLRLANPFDPHQHAAYQPWEMDLYPRMHLVESGDFIFTTRVFDGTYSFQPFVGNGTFTRVCDFPMPALDGFQGFDSTSVLLPIGRNRRGHFHNDFHAALMKCGGAGRQPYRLDLPAWNPATPHLVPWGWRPTGPRQMQKRRKHANATILPTGEILVTSGIDVGPDEDELDVHGVRDPEIYNSVLNEWRTLNEPSPAGMSPHGARNYHSVALLMPDGRVWSAGSSINHASGVENANLDIDLYEPWYHGNPGRPEITNAPSWVKPGEMIEVRTTFAEDIDRVVFVRCGSCTHAFNSDQRLIEFEFEHTGGDQLQVTMPRTNSIMPPGPYLIFTIRAWPGTPGLASFGADIQVRPAEQNG